MPLDNEHPLVTVYIPTHNRAQMVTQAIDSVLNQSYPNIEIIVINDGSKDNTDEVLIQYQKQYANFYFISLEVPQGACKARNKAIWAAKGKYISGLDDDDVFRPDHIQNLVDAFDPKYAFVCSPLTINYGSKEKVLMSDLGAISLNSLLHYNRVGNQVLTLTQRLQRVEGFDENFPAFQDYDLWVRLVHKFGDCFKISTSGYVQNVEHELGRISNNRTSVLNGLKMFYTKHKNIMTSAHQKTLNFMMKREKGEVISVIELVRLVNRHNYKALGFYFVNNILKLRKE